MTLDRRGFLARSCTAAACAVGLSRPGLMAFGNAAGGLQERLVVINARGGWDTMTVVPPYGLTGYSRERPTLAIAAPNANDPRSAVAIDPTAGIGIDPRCSGLINAWQRGEAAIIRKVGYPQPTGSHFTSQDIMSRGRRDLLNSDTRGWLGRLSDLHFSNGIATVGIGTGNLLDFQSNQVRPVVIDDTGGLSLAVDPRAPDDSALRNAIARRIHQRGVARAGSSVGIAASVNRAGASAYDLADRFALAAANYPGRTAYPNTRFGRELQDAARIIHGQLGSRVLYVDSGGFDTHSDQEASLDDNLPYVWDAIDAFARDLQDFGEWGRTTILVLSEFGRRNYENGSGGTDHGAALDFYVLGGRVNGGLKNDPITEADFNDERLGATADFRDVHSELIRGVLGLDPATVFDDYAVPTTGFGLLV